VEPSGDLIAREAADVREEEKKLEVESSHNMSSIFN
jgi:hypothetical protein